jgi:hypothetical protein
MSILITPSMERFAHSMKAHARSGVWNGREDGTRLPYYQNARRIHRESGTTLILTREYGYHTGGWFKNPEYERAWHLSLSFRDPLLGHPRDFDQPLAEAWVRCVFGEWVTYIWEETQTDQFRHIPPEVRHYRVFCDERWQPIIPRGEVYSTQFTERDWKSWSDARHAEEMLRKQASEREDS